MIYDLFADRCEPRHVSTSAVYYGKAVEKCTARRHKSWYDDVLYLPSKKLCRNAQ